LFYYCLCNVVLKVVGILMLTFKTIKHFYVLYNGKQIRYHVIEFLDGTKQLFTETDWEELKVATN